ncbi:MAG: permease-like cell division protein FtsX [Clostridia bacterium]|nr:permease-like cell division protein FtsX [Clostridia bacterium]
MRRYNIFYFFQQAFKGLWRNGLMSLAAITVLLSCLVLMGSFSLLVYNVNVNIEEVAQLNEIVVIAELDATDEQIAALSEEIAALDNIKEVKYISEEEGLESERFRYGEYSYLVDDIFENQENILPDVFKITYEDNSRVANLVYQLGQLDHVSKVNNRTDIANDIENIKSGVSFIFVWFLAILFVISIFIIINTIKLGVESRNREISAMRYIGATNFFMMTPFIIEGIIIGLISAGLAYLLQTILYNAIFNAMSNDYKMISVTPLSEVQTYLILGFIVIGVIAGILGSAISLRKYMKV